MAFDLMYAGGELLLELPCANGATASKPSSKISSTAAVSPLVIDERARQPQAVLFAAEESPAIERLTHLPIAPRRKRRRH